MGIIYNIPCPICGVSHGNRATHDPDKKYVVTSRHLFWEDVADFDPDKPFGVIQESLGRGTFNTIQHFSPNEDPTGSFTLVKGRILAVVKEWIAKGWIDKGEINGLLGGVAQGPPIGPANPVIIKPSPKQAPKERAGPTPPKEIKAAQTKPKRLYYVQVFNEDTEEVSRMHFSTQKEAADTARNVPIVKEKKPGYVYVFAGDEKGITSKDAIFSYNYKELTAKATNEAKVTRAKESAEAKKKAEEEITKEKKAAERKLAAENEETPKERVHAFRKGIKYYSENTASPIIAQGKYRGKKFYTEDSTGTFLPPERWPEILGLKISKNTMSEAEYQEYTAIVKEAIEKANEAEDAAKLQAEKAAGARKEAAQALYSQIKKGDWVEDTDGRKWQIVNKGSSTYEVLSPQGGKAFIGTLYAARIIPEPPEAKQQKAAAPAPVVKIRIKDRLVNPLQAQLQGYILRGTVKHWTPVFTIRDQAMADQAVKALEAGFESSEIRRLEPWDLRIHWMVGDEENIIGSDIEPPK
ncbi:MAG: hypothetical protein ABSF21_00090 [Dehalococcoidia bacterium]|jgi:hypothetical protein